MIDFLQAEDHNKRCRLSHPVGHVNLTSWVDFFNNSKSLTKWFHFV